MVTYFDLMMYVAFGHFKDNDATAKKALKEREEKARQLSACGLIGMADYGHKGWWVNGLSIYDPSRTVFEVLEDLIKIGVKRALVRRTSTLRQDGAYDYAEGHEVKHSIMSISDICEFVLKNSETLGAFAVKPISELSILDKLQKERPVTMSATQSAMEGFQMIYNSHGSAAAVVSSSGKLITNLSVSDMRGVKGDNFSALLLPVTEFLEKTRGGNVNPPMTCSPSDPYITVLSRMVTGGMHRIWVVDDKENPLGLIAMMDMLAIIVNPPPMSGSEQSEPRSLEQSREDNISMATINSLVSWDSKIGPAPSALKAVPDDFIMESDDFVADL
eukprot:Colp12_sorted_trinity150504_noHs@6729